MYLRSGQTNKPPKREFMSAYQIYYKEQQNKLLNNGIGINMIGGVIQKQWLQMPIIEKDKYEEQFEQHESKYQEQLIYFYGGNQGDFNQLKQFKNIPKKPKRPQIPELQYVAQNRNRYKNKNFSFKQIYTELLAEYARKPTEFKQIQEEKYNEEMIEYKEDIETWNNQYLEKFNQLQNQIEEKFKKRKQESDFEYQELQFNKSIRKLSQHTTDLAQTNGDEKLIRSKRQIKNKKQ